MYVNCVLWKLNYHETNVLGDELRTKDLNRGTVKCAVSRIGRIVPRYGRRLEPLSLQRYVWFSLRNHHFFTAI